MIDVNKKQKAYLTSQFLQMSIKSLKKKVKY